MANWADGILSPLKTASGLIQELMELRDTVKFGDAVVKLQAQIMAAQQGALAANTAQASLLEHIRDLKKEVARFETWDAEKEKYELQEIFPGSFACAIKEDARGTKPAHLICATCYENRQKSILQRADSGHLKCPLCNSTIRHRELGSSFGRPTWSPR